MKLINLKDISTIIMGQSPDSKTYNQSGEGIPFFQGKTDFGKITPIVRMYCSEPIKIAENLDILMSVRAPVGDVNITDKTCCIGRGLCAIRANNDLNQKYLYYFLRPLKQKLDLMATGSTFKAINKSILENIEISIPTIETQLKIAQALDSAQELIDKRQAQIEALDELIKSVFYDMFGEPITNPMCWKKKKLNLISEIVTGNTPSRKEDKYYGEDIEWIKSDNINTPFDYITKAKEYLSELGAKEGRVVDVGAILMTCIAGSLSCIGNLALTDRKVAFNQQINGIVCDKKQINNKFLYTQFNISKKYIQEASNHGMKRMISKGILSELEFIVPPLDRQNKYEKVFDNIKIKKELLQQSLTLLESNFKCIMQKAFKGELFN